MLPQFNPTNASVIRSRAGPSETSRGPSDVRVNMPSGPLQPLLAHSAHYLALYYLVNVYTAWSSFMKRTHFQLDDYKNLCSSLKWNNVINLARRVFMWRGWAVDTRGYFVAKFLYVTVCVSLAELAQRAADHSRYLPPQSAPAYSSDLWSQGITHTYTPIYMNFVKYSSYTTYLLLVLN